MIIRPATERDADAVSELIIEVAGRDIASELSEQARQLLLGSFEPAPVRKYLAGKYQYWVAQQAGQLVGVVGLKEARHLFHLFVAGSFQGQGLGRRLWEECVRSRAQGSGDITVNSSLNAVGFYEALGFISTGPVVSISGIPSQPLRWAVAGRQF